MRPSTILVLRSVTMCATSHSRCALASPTRNGRTFAAGTGEPGPAELVLVAWEVARGEIHPLQQVHGNDVRHKLRYLAEVRQAVLDAGRAERDIGRVAPHQIEIRIGGYVAHPAPRNSRDPADRPRHH